MHLRVLIFASFLLSARLISAAKDEWMEERQSSVSAAVYALLERADG